VAAPVISSTVPEQGYPQFVGTEISNLCSVLARPAILTGMFRDVLVRHFATETSIEQPELRALIWQPDPTTGILIESITRWNPQQTQQRPAVVIKRQGYRNTRIGLGGERWQLPPADRHGHPHYTTVWTGSHTLFCIAQAANQAELLATEVQRELHQFAQLILQEALLLRFGVVEVGEIAQLEEARDAFVVPVTAGYAYEESWTVRQQAPTLKRVSLSTILEC